MYSGIQGYIGIQKDIRVHSLNIPGYFSWPGWIYIVY